MPNQGWRNAYMLMALSVNACSAYAAEVPPNSQPPAAAQTAPPVTAPAQTLSLMAEAAMNAASIIAANDKLPARLDALSAPDWTATPLQMFVNTANGYATTGSAALPVPQTGSEAILREYGCTHVLVKRFERPQRSVQIAVYSFLNPYGAYGAYTTMRSGSQTIVVRGDASSEDDRSVSFWQGRRFVVVQTTKDDDEVSKTLVGFLADKLAPAINEHAELPPLVLVLPMLDRVKGSERFFLGPQAARRYLTLVHFNRLLIDKAVGQAMAEYAYLSPFAERMKGLVIDYGTAEQARRVFESYSSAVAEDHRTWVVDSAAQLCKMSGSYSWCGARGSHLYMVLGARHKESALLLARQMTY